MLTSLAQNDTTGTPGLTSVAAIIVLTWVLVGLAKKFFEFRGRVTLGVSLGVAVGLTILALATGQLAGDPVAALTAVVVMVAGAAGIDASAKTLFTGSPKALLLGLITLGVLTSAGCSTMTPSQRYAVTSNAFSGTVSELAVLVEAGVIDDAALPAIADTAHAIDDELDALDEALRNDTPLDFPFVLARVERLLGRLAQYQLDAEGVTHGPNESDPRRLGGHPALATSPGACTAGEGRTARADRSGTRSDPRPSQAIAAEPGQRDRLAAQLRYLGWRYHRLTVTS